MQIHLFATNIDSGLILGLTASYGLCAAATAYEARVVRAKSVGYLSRTVAYTPVWMEVVPVAMWVTWLAVLVLSGWYALALLGIRYALGGLSILDRVGALLVTPLLDIETASAVRVANDGAVEIEAMYRDRARQYRAIRRNERK